MDVNNTTETLPQAGVVLAAARVPSSLWLSVKQIALSRNGTAQEMVKEALAEWVERNGGKQ